MDRREFLAASAAGVLAARLPAWPRRAATLRARASANGILYGSAAAQGVLQADAAYAAAVARECAIITPEAELKWGTLRPSATGFNFGPADWLLQFAQSNNMQMRGHTLVFWQSIPGWVTNTMNAGNAQEILQNHISTVCGHYAGKLHSWDVVNEAIQPEDHNPDGIRNSVWQAAMGTDYIPLAFNVARQADPHALLVYNDFGVEYDFPGVDARRTAILNLISKLKSQNVPIQAFGLQAHLYGGSVDKLNTNLLTGFLKSISNMGLKVLVTELDVQDKGLPADPNARDQAIAQSYSKFLNAVLQNTNVIVVETWGLSDKYTWLKNHAPRQDGLDVRTLPYDANYQPKSAVYQAIAQAFDAAPPRTV
jgi:endo-1,4-beta-xylanase